MNLEGIIRQVGEIGAHNTRLNSDTKDFINRAQKTICERRNWTFMHDVITATIPANQASVQLPAEFKQPDDENSPVSYFMPDSTIPNPVSVVSRAAITRAGSLLLARDTRFHAAQVPIRACYFEQNRDGIWTLNILQIASQTTETPFTISAYFYMADLEKSGDQNSLTNHGELLEALISNAKSMAYDAEDPTDKRIAACNERYEQHIKLAIYSDTSRKNGGRALHA